MLPLALSSAPTMTLTAAAATATAAVAATTSWYRTTGCQEAKGGKQEDENSSFRVEVHLMDKIQQKSYLQETKENIPSTLRILAVDLPEMRTSAFSGTCQLSHDKIFVDDLAPPKEVILRDDDDDVTKKFKKQQLSKLKVAQKALVKSLVLCRSPQSQQRVGVELLEASVADLNRYKLRKTHVFGKFKYDPGKYYDTTNQEDGISARRDGDHGDDLTDRKEEEILTDNLTHEDETEAPWNQYAWIEELNLRVGGKVAFGEPMEKSSTVERKFFGNVYKATIPAASKFWEWPLPKFMQSDPEGVDGEKQTRCRACHKPHAVIANGAALQRVPSSLRLLQKYCKDSAVPLFVIHDPRVWGGNTHDSLPEALREMRRTVKNRIIGQALKKQGSSAYARGRIVGQVETEAKWILKDQKERARKFFTPGGTLGGQRRRSDAVRDWSQLDAAALEKKLVERDVIQTRQSEDKSERVYTPAMVDVARRCVREVEAEQVGNEQEKSEAPSGDVAGQNAGAIKM